MSCTKFFKEKIRKIKRIEGEPYTSWYKFLNFFWYSADLKKWKIGWCKKDYKRKEDDIDIKKREYFSIYLQCHGQNFIGNRKVDKKIHKNINCQPDKNEKKIKKEWI